jgi:hypothetical protein
VTSAEKKQPHKSKPEVYNRVPQLKQTFTMEQAIRVRRNIQAAAPDDHDMIYSMLMGDDIE